MIRAMRERSWFKDAAGSDQDQERGPALGLRRSSAMTDVGRAATPWYLKLLCEEGDVDPESQGAKLKPVKQTDSSGLRAARVERDISSSSHQHLDHTGSDSVSQREKPVAIAKIRTHDEGDSPQSRPQTLDHVFEKKIKSNKKSLAHLRAYQPYCADPSLLKKHKHGTPTH